MKTFFGLLFSIAVVFMALTIGRMSDNASHSGAGASGRTGYEGGTLKAEGATEGDSFVGAGQPVTGRRGDLYIVIDRYANKLFLRSNNKVLLEALCSTGSGGELVDSVTSRRWRFDTPAGVYAVHTMLKNPWWRKPDWAFVEEGIPVPKNESERLDDEMMGDYAIGFGDGYYIHGTIYERLLGKAVTHGCVRLAAEDLRKLYHSTRMGMLIYVF